MRMCQPGGIPGYRTRRRAAGLGATPGSWNNPAATAAPARRRPLERSPDAMPRRPTRRLSLQWLATTLLAAAAAPGAALAADDAVVLSISGHVGKPNAGARRDFTMAELAALPQQTFSVHTPWYKEPRSFSGPLLRDVLAAAGASGTELTAIALNDYKVSLPFEDVQRWRVLLATARDGQPMSVREKGPLFIVYPYDDSPELRSATYYARSAWQLRHIEVK